MTGLSVLIVEDDSTMARALKDNFEADGYHVTTLGDGAAGLATALSRPPDLLLLDIMLPKTNGYEICRAVRSRKMDVPIIMLTAQGQESDIIRGLELGADDYITKPFSVRELLARAKALLRRHRAGVSNVSEFGDCRLDLVAHKFFRSGREVILTSKEFRLLTFFAQRAGRAVTRDQILDAVWGTDITVNDRSVDRCVTTLRAKIEPDPHHPTCIRTIRDIGYRFDPP